MPRSFHICGEASIQPACLALANVILGKGEVFDRVEDPKHIQERSITKVNLWIEGCQFSEKVWSQDDTPVRSFPGNPLRESSNSGNFPRYNPARGQRQENRQAKLQYADYVVFLLCIS
jgi:hypothetical protein